MRLQVLTSKREKTPVKDWLVFVLKVIAMWCIFGPCWMTVMPQDRGHSIPPVILRMEFSIFFLCRGSKGRYIQHEAVVYLMPQAMPPWDRQSECSCQNLLPAQFPPWQPGTCGSVVPGAHFSCLMVHISRCLWGWHAEYILWCAILHKTFLYHSVWLF